MKTILFTVIALLGANFANADGLNALRVHTRTQWPDTITTVGPAARWILAPTGYRLMNRSPNAPDSDAIASRRIASAALSPQTLPIDEALLLIAGPDTVVYVDHEHHLVAFGFGGKTL
jgi:hypothetical protein